MSIKKIPVVEPKSQKNIMETLRDLLRLATTCKIKSITVSVHYTDPQGNTIYSTYDAHSDDYPGIEY